MEAESERERLAVAAAAAAKQRSPFDEALMKFKAPAVKPNKNSIIGRQNATKSASQTSWKNTSHAAPTKNGRVHKQASSFREAEDEAFALQTVQNDIVCVFHVLSS